MKEYRNTSYILYLHLYLYVFITKITTHLDIFKCLNLFSVKWLLDKGKTVKQNITVFCLAFLVLHWSSRCWMWRMLKKIALFIMKFLTFHLNDALTYTSIAIQLVANQPSLCSIHLFLLLLTLHSKNRGKKKVREKLKLVCNCSETLATKLMRNRFCLF